MTQTLEWWQVYENIATLANWMADEHYDVKVVAHMVEKPHRYTEEWEQCEQQLKAEGVIG